MSANHDISRVVRSWIRVEEQDSADQILQVVLSRLDSTPQRRSWWPAWRSRRMNVFTKAAIAAVVLVVTAIGYQLLPGRVSSPGGPSTTPTPVPTPSLDARPEVPPAGPLDPGDRHFARLEGVGFTFEVPDGWTSNGDFGLDHEAGIGPEGRSFILWTQGADAVFADPCERTLSEPVGPSAADLAAAIAEMPQIELVGGPTDVTVGAQPGQLVVIRVPDAIPCEPDQFYLWGDEINTGQARYATATGMTIYVWLIDVGGARVQIDGETYEGAGTELGDELRSIIDSIEFE